MHYFFFYTTVVHSKQVHQKMTRNFQQVCISIRLSQVRKTSLVLGIALRYCGLGTYLKM